MQQRPDYDIDGIEQEELARQLQRGPTAGAGPMQAPPAAGVAGAGMQVPDEAAKPDTSAFKTDGYGAPQHSVARSGKAPSGWDQAKWDDPNHQTPKYAAGGIYAQHDPNDPAQIQSVADQLLKAYPGATYNGKDKITLPSGEVIDFVGGYNSNGPKEFTWQSSLDAQGGAPGGGMPQQAGGARSLIPTDSGFGQSMQDKIMQILGGEGQFEREELLRQLGVQ